MPLDQRHLGLGQRRLRPARPRRRPGERDRTAQEMGITAPLESVPAEGIGGLASASRRWKWRAPTRPSPTAASTTTRPRSARSNSPTARSTKPARRRRPGPDLGRGLRSDPDPRGRDHLRGPAPATPRSAARRGRQDRHLRGRVRRLVRRLHADVLDRGLGRPPAVARIHRLRRPHRRADLAALHGSRPGRRLPRIRSPRGACPNSPASTANTPRRGTPNTKATKKKKKTSKAKTSRRTTKRRGETRAATKRPPSPKAPPNPHRLRHRPQSPPPSGGGISPG